MTRRTNARIAGIAYLLYIAVAFPSMLLSDRATAGADPAAKIVTMAQHAADIRLTVVLSMIGGLCALVLAVTLYAITRDQDRDLAMLGLTCRVAEGVIGAAAHPATLGLMSIVTAANSSSSDTGAVQALAAFVLNQPWTIGAWFFALGSTTFSWLLLRGRMVPVWLAWLGVVSSALVAIALPLQIARVLAGPATQLVWLPVAVFELVIAVWFILKGVAPPLEARQQEAR